MEEFRQMILAGDIGGTNAVWPYFDVADGQLQNCHRIHLSQQRSAGP